MGPSTDQSLEGHAAGNRARQQAANALQRHMRAFSDFPRRGIMFQDLSTLYAEPSLLREVTDLVVQRYEGEFDHIAGVEARGFLLGMAVSWAASVPLVLVRKAGKLPGTVHARTYQSEYATSTLELQYKAIPQQARVLLVDDVVATGETLKAAAHLIERSGAQVAGIAALLELCDLGGRSLLGPYPLFTIHQLR
jgi:adenine phosphoribosyltransferase